MDDDDHHLPPTPTLSRSSSASTFCWLVLVLVLVVLFGSTEKSCEASPAISWMTGSDMVGWLVCESGSSRSGSCSTWTCKSGGSRSSSTSRALA